MTPRHANIHANGHAPKTRPTEGKGRWVPCAEYAASKNLHPRTIRYQVASETLVGRWEPGRGRGGKVLMIWVPEGDKGNPTKEAIKETTKETDRGHRQNGLSAPRTTTSPVNGGATHALGSTKEVIKEKTKETTNTPSALTLAAPVTVTAEAIREIGAAHAWDALTPVSVREVCAARWAIVQAFKAAGLPGRPATARDRFCAAYNERRVLDLPEVRGPLEEARLHPATLRRWVEADAAGGVRALAPKWGGNRNKGRFNGNKVLTDLLKGWLLEHPYMSILSFHHEMQEHATYRHKGFVQDPSYSTVQGIARRLLAEPEFQRMHADRRGPLARKRFEPSFGGYADTIERFNDRWEFDGTKAEVALLETDLHGREKVSRWQVLFGIDVWSRFGVALLAPTASTTGSVSALGKMMLTLGVPQLVVMDNGPEYTSTWFRNVLRDLEIEAQWCEVGKPNQKGVIERWIGTCAHGLFPKLKGYLGHDIARRKEIDAAAFEAMIMGRRTVELRMTPAQFQEELEAWLRRYNRRQHSSIGEAPIDRLRRSYETALHVPKSYIGALALALYPPAPSPDGDGVRTVGREGIPVSGAWYRAEGLEKLIGQKVRVKIDPFDAGTIYVYRMDREDAAAECIIAQNANLLGSNRKALALAVESAVAAERTEQRRESRDLRKRLRRELANGERRLAAIHDADPLPQPPPGEFTNPQLEAALVADVARRSMGLQPLGPDAPALPVNAVELPSQRRDARWYRDALSAETIDETTDAELRWHEQRPEFSAWLMGLDGMAEQYRARPVKTPAQLRFLERYTEITLRRAPAALEREHHRNTA